MTGTSVIMGTGVPWAIINVGLPSHNIRFTKVGADGRWFLPVTEKLLVGQSVMFTQTEPEKYESGLVFATVAPASNEQTVQPIVFEPIRANAKRIDGTGIPDALVQARFPCGNIFGGWVDNESNWHVLVMDELPADSVVKVTQYEIFKGKAESEPVLVTVVK